MHESRIQDAVLLSGIAGRAPSFRHLRRRMQDSGSSGAAHCTDPDRVAVTLGKRVCPDAPASALAARTMPVVSSSLFTFVHASISAWCSIPPPLSFDKTVAPPPPPPLHPPLLLFPSVTVSTTPDIPFCGAGSPSNHDPFPPLLSHDHRQRPLGALSPQRQPTHHL